MELHDRADLVLVVKNTGTGQEVEVVRHPVASLGALDAVITTTLDWAKLADLHPELFARERHPLVEVVHGLTAIGLGEETHGEP